MDQQTANAIAKVCAGVLGTVFAWKLLGPERQEKIIGFLNELAVRQQQRAWQQAQEEKARRQMALAAPRVAPPPTELVEAVQSLFSPRNASVDTPKPPVPQLEPDARWREALVPPAVVLILGKRGSGKSALAYRLLELFRHRLTPLVVSPPQWAKNLLPDWIGIAPSLEDLPQNCIALIDEAYLAFQARQSHSEGSQAMVQLLNLSRQRNQTLLFVTQEARQVDRNIASAASMLVFKELGLVQPEFDRPELRKLVEPAREALENKSASNRRSGPMFTPPTRAFGVCCPASCPVSGSLP
ncbi:MAG: ATP-binding protein [Dehalococcoidia bacterium]